MGPTPPGMGVMNDAFSPHTLEINTAHNLSAFQSIDSDVDDYTLHVQLAGAIRPLCQVA
jgi:hypothetical protein